MPELDAKVNIRCTAAEREKFQRQCRRNGLTPSAVMRRLLLDFTRGKITYTTTQEAN